MPSQLRKPSSRCASTVLLLLGALGCVDPQGRYDAFIERTADMRGRDAGMVTPSDRFDFSGRYLLALSTTLAPAQPILFSSDVDVAADLETIDVTFQPLTTDAADPPRAATGESLEVDGVPYDEDGSFGFDLGEVTVPSDANPISGSAIVATVTITATAFPMTAELPALFCGEASGMVSVPLALDLAGSTIGAVETETADLTDVEPVFRCPD
jgi:hypothetical protein